MFSRAQRRFVSAGMKNQSRLPLNPLTLPLPCNILDISDGLHLDIARQGSTSIKLLDASRRYQSEHDHQWEHQPDLCQLR
jgi:hypothetical protein